MCMRMCMRHATSTRLYERWPNMNLRPNVLRQLLEYEEIYPLHCVVQHDNALRKAHDADCCHPGQEAAWCQHHQHGAVSPRPCGRALRKPVENAVSQVYSSLHQNRVEVILAGSVISDALDLVLHHHR